MTAQPATRHDRSNNRPQLRIHQPPPEPASGYTLADWYEQKIRPESEARNHTLGEHQLALHRWRLFCDSLAESDAPKYRTPGPVLSEIDTEMVARFRAWMLETPHPNRAGKVAKASAFSARKSLNYVRGWLEAAAESPGESGMYQRIGRVKAPKVKPGDHRVVIPDDHVDALMRHATAAEWPTRWIRRDPGQRRGQYVGNEFSPALFWRVTIVLLYMFGQRRGDALGLNRDNRPHRWGNVRDETLSPQNNGHAINDSGWLLFEQSKTSKQLCLPIPKVARQWLEALAATFPERTATDFLLPIPRSKDQLYPAWRAITDAAGVAPKPLMKMVDGIPQMTERRYQLKNFRSTAASVIESHAKIGRLVTGHASDQARGVEIDNGIFDERYNNPEQSLVDGLNTLPLPSTFTELLAEHAAD